MIEFHCERKTVRKESEIGKYNRIVEESYCKNVRESVTVCKKECN